MVELLRINFEIIKERLLEKYTLEEVFEILGVSEEYVLDVFEDRILDNLEDLEVTCSTDYENE